MYKVVDLFAGAGGLSLGFKQTGEYDIKVAFENNHEMQDTYRLNHPDTDVRGDVCAANYTAIQEQYGAIDVVIGGPPCQGFSNANRQKKHTVNKNNMLVKQYVRAIVELQPKAFVMENVSMIKSQIHRFYLERGDEELIEKYNIRVRETPLHLIDAQYMFDGILNIIQNRQEAERHLWPDTHFSELNIIYKAAKNIEKLKKALTKYQRKLLNIAEIHIGLESENPIIEADHEAFQAVKDYYDGTRALADLKARIEPAIMFQKMLIRSCEIIDNNIVIDRFEQVNGITAIIRSFAVFDYLKAVLGSEENGYVIDSKVLCAADYGAPQKRMRFVVIGIKKSISEKIALPIGSFDEEKYRTVREAISDLEDAEPFVDRTEDVGISLEEKAKLGVLGQSLRDTAVLRNHIITATTDIAMQRFKKIKQGKNFHSLDEALKINTYTDASRTQNTIYQRLNYDKPSGTVVNVRKSMWIHPTLDRAISIREAARLQTFPDSFVFCGSKDKQYQQVGNAVPPIMAKSIAEKLASILNENLRKSKMASGGQPQQIPAQLYYVKNSEYEYRSRRKS